ncbi:MAG: hypothetical protein VKP62_06165, partial [Candidatus Sericytochromatia bacterium]|nr:hypothetical protein [Candidatus Sericytochromatia bacterium]
MRPERFENKRRAPWLSLMLAGSFVAAGVAACVPAGPQARLFTSQLEPGQASLRLDWNALAQGRRRLLAFDVSPGSLKVSLVDHRNVVRKEMTQAAGDSQAFFTDVPLLPRVLVRVLYLDAGLNPIPGSILRGLGAIKEGENQLELSEASTVGGAIMEALIARDLAASTAIASSVDFAAVASAVIDMQRTLNAAHPGLLDPQAIAAAWPASGAIPVATSTFLPPPASLLLKSDHWPVGATAWVEVSDPTSRGVVMDGTTRLLDPVAPGTWTVRVVPDEGQGIASTTQVVYLAPGKRVDFPIAFGNTDALPPLTMARGAAAFGVLPVVGGSSALVLAGGIIQPQNTATTPFGAETARASDVVLVGVNATSPLNLAPMASGLTACSGPASTVHGGKLYIFGGFAGSSIASPAVRCLDLQTASSTAKVAMPLAQSLYGMAAATIGDSIYLTGGFNFVGNSPASGTYRYLPLLDAWSSEVVMSNPAGTRSLPVFDAACFGAASAVAQETWYVFGGRRGLDGSVNGVVHAWKPGVDAFFRQVAKMPTPRYGSVAVATGGRIWVIGGIEAGGLVSRAVEVYDPVANSWSRKPPLRQERAFAAAGVLDGKIVVSGGLLGAENYDAMPTSSVERLTP